MKNKIFTALALFVLFLTGCSSLDCEISRCNQKCLSKDGKPAKCCNCTLIQYQPRAIFHNDGSSNYDSYRVVKPCMGTCEGPKISSTRVYK